MDAYAARVRESQEAVFAQERPRLIQASRMLADSLAAEDEPDRVIHAFGAGHSHMLVEEAFRRAGGLVPVHPILDPNLTSLGGGRSFSLEGLQGYADTLLVGEDLRPGEVLVVASNSGINVLPVEMALAARKAGLRVIAITSLEHGGRVDSRHPQGYKLCDLADVVIDTHAPPGDAAVEISALNGRTAEQWVAPLSTVAGATIWNALVAEVARLIAESGREPLCFHSQNMPGGAEANGTLTLRYQERNRLYY